MGFFSRQKKQSTAGKRKSQILTPARPRVLSDLGKMENAGWMRIFSMPKIFGIDRCWMPGLNLIEASKNLGAEMRNGIHRIHRHQKGLDANFRGTSWPAAMWRARVVLNFQGKAERLSQRLTKSQPRVLNRSNTSTKKAQPYLSLFMKKWRSNHFSVISVTLFIKFKVLERSLWWSAGQDFEYSRRTLLKNDEKWWSNHFSILAVAVFINF